MRIVKIETIKKQRRIVYDVNHRESMKFGPEPMFRDRLKNDDSEVLEFLDEYEEEFEEEEKDESDEISSVEWFFEDDEL